MSEWEQTCLKEHGKILTGLRSHYCWDWDGLTVDETMPEFEACTCFSQDVAASRPSPGSNHGE